METRVTRAIGIGFLVCLLAGFLVWSGAITPNPDQHRYPGNTALTNDYDTYVGQHAQVSGTVLSTNPVVIEITSYSATRTLTVQNTESSVSTGEQMVVFGVVQPGETIVREASMTRFPWEAWYMYLVSFLGGLWVLGRIVTGWRINTERWTVEPRDDPWFTWRGR